jgi:ankyrin repeat protein
MTPLDSAINKGANEICALLLEHGADPEMSLFLGIFLFFTKRTLLNLAFYDLGRTK